METHFLISHQPVYYNLNVVNNQITENASTQELNDPVMKFSLEDLINTYQNEANCAIASLIEKKNSPTASLEDWLTTTIDASEETYMIGDSPNATFSWSQASILSLGKENMSGLSSEQASLMKDHGYDDHYRFLSNFYESPMLIENRVYATVEHYYQAAKFTIDSEPYLKIVDAKTPKEARDLAQDYANQADLQGDQHMVNKMKKGLWYKFIQEDGTPTELGLRLLATEDALIVEGNRRKNGSADTRWGSGFDFTLAPSQITVQGKNLLGKLLMEMREILKNP